MEFPEFHLNEPYVLSPYKICVSMYVYGFYRSKYLWGKSNPYFGISEEDKMYPDTKSYARIEYSGLAFRLMTSMDMAYADYLAMLEEHLKEDLTCGILSQMFMYFEKKTEQLLSRENGIVKMFDFFDKIGALTVPVSARKALLTKKVANQNVMLHVEIDRFSMAGLYLRRMKVHFDRLAYSEVMTLRLQFVRYATGKDEIEYLKHLPTPKVEKIDELEHLGNVNRAQLVAQINLPLIQQCLDATSNRFPQDLKRHLTIMIDKAKSIAQEGDEAEGKLPEEERESSLKAETSKKSEVTVDSSMDADELIDLNDSVMDISFSPKSNLQRLAKRCSTANAVSPTLGVSEEMMSPYLKKKEFKEDLSVSKERAVHQQQLRQSKVVNLHPQCASQHFLISQVQRILTNEAAALSPTDIVNLISFYFEQHTPFYYNRFIKLNYFANLTMLKEAMANYGASLTVERSSNGSGGGGGFGGGARDAVPGIFNVNTTAAANAERGPLNVPGVARTGGGGAPDIPNGFVMPGQSGPITKFGFLTGGKKAKDLFQSINFYSDIHYLKFINSLRVNNYTAAQECFYNYFDLRKYRSPTSSGWSQSLYVLATMHGGSPLGFQAQVQQNKQLAQLENMSSNNFCWSALNLAIMYAYFRYYRLAYEALTDCITVARERKDERCLQYAMLWMLLILQQFDQTSTENAGGGKRAATDGVTKFHSPHNDLHLTENLIHLIKMNSDTLPYVAAMAYLHVEKLYYLRPIYPSVEEAGQVGGAVSSGGIRLKTPTRVPLSAKPTHLAVKARLNDLLAKTMMKNAAILNAYGASHEAAFLSQALLMLEMSATVGGQPVALVDDSQAIAVRNLARYWWTVRGQAARAVDLLMRFRRHYRQYNSPVRVIIEQAMADIQFDRALGTGDWTRAERAINLVRCLSRNRALVMQAKLKQRQGEPMAALEFLEALYTSNGREGRTVVGNAKASVAGNNFFRPDHLRRSTSKGSNETGSRSFVIGTNFDETLVVIEPEATAATKPGGGQTNASEEEQLGQRPSAFQLPATREPEEERPLSADSDPYMAVSAALLKATLLTDLSSLLEVVVAAKSHGFRQLEARALLEVARIEQAHFGEYAESQQIVNTIWVRLAAGGALRDLATAYHLTAANHFSLSKQEIEADEALVAIPLPVPLKIEGKKLTALEVARWAYQRALLVWQKIDDRFELLDALNLAALIEHAAGDLDARNQLAKRSRTIMIQLLKR